MNPLTQYQQALRFVAGLLLALQPQERLLTIQEINNQLNVGIGTIQKAINLLQTIGAVRLTARGHRGTFVEQLDYATLWQQAGRGLVRLLLPSVDAPEFSGLSDGIDQQLGALGVHARMSHQRGALARLQSVRDGTHDACVVSELAYQSAELVDLKGWPIAGTQYYQPGSVALLSTRPSSSSSAAQPTPLRVGYDPDSLDHYLLTRAEFARADGASDGVMWVTCRYTHLLSALLAGVIDCGIWHRVHIGLALDLLPIVAHAPTHSTTRALLKRCESAYFVIRKDRADVAHLLKTIDSAAVCTAQTQAKRAATADQRALEKLLRQTRQLQV